MTYIHLPALQGPTIVNYVRAAAGETDDLLHQRLAAVDISLPQLELLDHLVRLSGPASLGRLAELLDCSRSNVTQLVDRLQRRGLVGRMVDSQDRRTVLARLTREGIRRHHVGLAVLIHL
jgi:DNA-binding MarR family transcriptional regulator